MSSSELVFTPLAGPATARARGFRGLARGGAGEGFSALGDDGRGEAGLHPGGAHRPPTEEELRERVRGELEAGFAEREARAAEARAEAIARLAATLREEREERLATLARASIALAFQVAERLVARELGTDPGLPLRALAAGLGELGLEGELALHAHPALAEALRGEAEALGELGIVAVHDDAQLAEGGLRAERGGEQFDLGLADRLSQLEDAVVAALGEG